MSLQTYDNLVKFVEKSFITAKPENINGASIDVTLGNYFKIEAKYGSKSVDLSKKQNIALETLFIEDGDPFPLMPGESVLAETKEVFNLPNYLAAKVCLKSSCARNFLDHLNAGWCDPGWHGSTLTMELVNNNKNHVLLLRPGMKIAQMIFFKGDPVPPEHSYATKGQYNNQRNAQESKGIR